MGKKITGVLLRPGKKLEIVGFMNDEINELYERIGCKAFDCRHLCDGVTVWFDDEFMIKQNQVIEEQGYINVTEVVKGLNLMGNLLFLGGTDEDGYTQSVDMENFSVVVDGLKGYRIKHTIKPDIKVTQFKTIEELGDLMVGKC